MGLNNYAPSDYQYFIHQKLASDNPISDSRVIKDLIQKDVSTDNQAKRDMYDGVMYYKGKHDILNRTITYFVDGIEKEDKLAANRRVANAFHKILVDQKTAYLVGKPIKFASEDEKYNEKISEYLNDEFNDLICELVKNISNKGQEWLHPYITENGELDFIIIPAEQVIPIYDTKTQKQLISLIRYYSIAIVDNQGKEKTRYKVEWWDNEKVTYYTENKDGNYYFDNDEPINPQYHWYSFNSLKPDEMIANSWGCVPFVQFKNNEELSPDLAIYKALIDDYDLNRSDLSNNLADIADAIWVLKNYDGESISEFRNNLKAYKAIKVSTDDSGGAGAEPVTVDIPIEARKYQLESLKEDIFTLGMGLDVDSDKFGQNPSGVALKFLYGLLDLKADVLERKMKKSLREFLWFVTEYINRTQSKSYDYKEVKFTFNRNMISNTSEMIDNAVKSKGIVSDETVLANHPFVEDISEEIKKIEEQGNINLDNYEITDNPVNPKMTPPDMMNNSGGGEA